MPKPIRALVKRLHAEQAAGGGVLEQTRDEPGDAAELRAPAQGQQHDHDQRDIGRHVGDAQRRAQRGVRDAASEHGDHDERAHQPPLPWKSAGQVVGALADDQQHLVDAGEVHGRGELRVVEERGAAVVDGAHPPDRNAPREESARARGHHEVAHLQSAAVARHVLEAHGAARLALDDAGRARAHGVGADGRGRIGEHLDDGGAGPDVHDPADEPVGRDDRGQPRARDRRDRG